MRSQPDSTSLLEILGRFAAALRVRGPDAEGPIASLAECIVDDGLPPAARVQVYRNNGQAVFEGALARTYPVLRRRVGDACFARLAAEFRDEHASRSGDLHWVGAGFPDWLASRANGTGYEWLADLARLEWACEDALVSQWLPSVQADALAQAPPDSLADVSLSLQPGLRLVGPRFPIWSVWQANQPGMPGDAVDLENGPQQVAVMVPGEGLELHALPIERFRFVQQVSDGRTLAEAVDASGLAVEELAGTLAWAFDSGLVTSVRPSEAA